MIPEGSLCAARCLLSTELKGDMLWEKNESPFLCLGAYISLSEVTTNSKAQRKITQLWQFVRGPLDLRWSYSVDSSDLQGISMSQSQLRVKWSTFLIFPHLHPNFSFTWRCICSTSEVGSQNSKILINSHIVHFKERGTNNAPPDYNQTWKSDSQLGLPMVFRA